MRDEPPSRPTENSHGTLSAAERDELIRFRAAFDVSPAPTVWVAFSGDRILKVNQALAAMTGVSERDYIGADLARLHPPCSMEAIRDLRLRVIAEGSGTAEIAALTASGDEIPVHLTVSLARGPDGLFAQGVLRDLTAQRRMEEELLRMRKLESLGVFAGGIAHDFNNVLTSIMGNLALARLHAGEGSRAGEPLARAERAALRAREIIRQLLSFSRGSEPVRSEFDLVALVREAVEPLPPPARAKIAFHPPDAPLPVLADRARMAQLFGNLLANADQATESFGRVEVRFDTLDLPAGNPFNLKRGRYHRVLVRDDGPGIPDGMIGRIFDPYFSTKPMGTGLGLAIAHAVATEHGGLVTAESPAGCGALFHVLLPGASRDA